MILTHLIFFFFNASSGGGSTGQDLAATTAVTPSPGTGIGVGGEDGNIRFGGAAGIKAGK